MSKVDDGEKLLNGNPDPAVASSVCIRSTARTASHSAGEYPSLTTTCINQSAIPPQEISTGVAHPLRLGVVGVMNPIAVIKKRSGQHPVSRAAARWHRQRECRQLRMISDPTHVFNSNSSGSK